MLCSSLGFFLEPTLQNVLLQLFVIFLSCHFSILKKRIPTLLRLDNYLPEGFWLNNNYGTKFLSLKKNGSFGEATCQTGIKERSTLLLLCHSFILEYSQIFFKKKMPKCIQKFSTVPTFNLGDNPVVGRFWNSFSCALTVTQVSNLSLFKFPSSLPAGEAISGVSMHYEIFIIQMFNKYSVFE